MLQWIQGTALHPQGRAIVYGALFDEALKGLADRSYWEHPSIPQLGKRRVHALFHTLQSTDVVQKLGLSAHVLKDLINQSLPQMHAFAEANGLRTIRTLRAYTAEHPPCFEKDLLLTP